MTGKNLPEVRIVVSGVGAAGTAIIKLRSIAAAQLAEIADEIGETAYAARQFELARRVFEQVALADDFADFLTLPAYTAAIDN